MAATTEPETTDLPETEDTRTIWERVNAVLAALPTISKDGKAPDSMGGFAFRSIEDITGALKTPLANHGVTIVPTVVQRIDSERRTSNGKSLWVTDLLIRFDFYGPDGDTLSAEMWGCGSDSGDKATQKAVTAAFKSLLTVTFCISDNAMDAERYDHAADSPPPPRPVPEGFETDDEAKAEVARVRELVEEASAWEESLPEWIRDQGFPWPWPRPACDAIARKAQEILDLVSPDGSPPPPVAVPHGSAAEHKTEKVEDTAGVLSDPLTCASCHGSLADPAEPGCLNDNHPL